MAEIVLLVIGASAVGTILLHSSRSDECKQVLADMEQAKNDVADLTKRVQNLEAAANTWVKNEKRNGRTA